MLLSTNIHDAHLDGDLGKLPAALGRIAAAGLHGAELSIPGLDAIRNGKLDRRKVQEVCAILAYSPLSISFHAPDALDLMDREESLLQRQVLGACLELCSQVGAKILVLHPGRWVNENDFGVKKRFRPTPEEAQERMEEEAILLREAADAFPEVTIALENARPFLPYSPYCYAEFPQQLAQQVERVARPNVRACLDTGHLHMAARLHGFDAIDAVQRLGHRIVHLHVHDNFGRTGNWSEKTQTQLLPFGKGDLHMPPGMGDIDFAALLGEFLGSFDGITVCELRNRYLHDFETHMNTFRDLMSRLRHESPTAFLV
ncbi:MAG: hypothetical protein RL318_3107 [Fibrobacterota bacterium]|jgi:sugar phosphate isomerase/epimerase